jgi:M6 family metalloprotease-like protein
MNRRPPIRNVSALFVVGFFLMPLVARAVPPAPGQESMAGMKTCYVNHVALEKRVLATRGAPALAAPPALLNPRVLVLRVQFSDTSFVSDQSAGFFQDVQDFFVENSFGIFRPDFTMSPIFTLPGNEAAYGNNCGGDIACHIDELITDALAAANPAINFNNYDQIMIYHAGYGEESTNVPSDIWSLFFPAEGMPSSRIRVDGKDFDGAMIVPELERNASALGVICHEYGHQLGLPDIYDTSFAGGRSTAGAWDLMDYPWTGSPVGANPPHLGAWSKRFLGFGSTLSVSSGPVSLSPIELAPGQSMEIFRSGSEYFLLEYRLMTSAAKYDKALPQAAGLLVWHVDESVAEDVTLLKLNSVNAPSLNGFGYYGVDLVEADGDAGAYFDKGVGDAFVDGQSLSAPASNLFSGVVSTLVLSNIQGVGGPTASAEILFLGATNHQAVARAISYPNPATGKVRSGASVGTWATLRVQLSRPFNPATFNAKIFTIRGGLVREIQGQSFNFRQDLSQDFEWVYEYDWNGRDDTGADVASGVYYLVFDVEGEKVKKPLVIQR